MFDALGFPELDFVTADLDDETRARVAEIYRLRIEHLDLKRQEFERRLVLLHAPNEAAERELAEFSRLFVKPVRLRLSEALNELVGGAIELDGLKTLLPVVVMGVLQHVNVPLLVAAYDLDLDMVKDTLDRARKYLTEALGDA